MLRSNGLDVWSMVLMCHTCAGLLRNACAGLARLFNELRPRSACSSLRHHPGHLASHTMTTPPQPAPLKLAHCDALEYSYVSGRLAIACSNLTGPTWDGALVISLLWVLMNLSFLCFQYLVLVFLLCFSLAEDWGIIILFVHSILTLIVYFLYFIFILLSPISTSILHSPMFSLKPLCCLHFFSLTITLLFLCTINMREIIYGG